MTTTGEIQQTGSHAGTAVMPAVRQLLLLSFGFLVVQTSLTDYDTPSNQTGTGWALFGAVMLWVVYRWRSRLARAFIVITSLFGGVLYAVGAVGDIHAAVLSVLFFGQAIPLVLRPIREHVRHAS